MNFSQGPFFRPRPESTGKDGDIASCFSVSVGTLLISSFATMVRSNPT